MGDGKMKLKNVNSVCATMMKVKARRTSWGIELGDFGLIPGVAVTTRPGRPPIVAIPGLLTSYTARGW